MWIVSRPNFELSRAYYLVATAAALQRHGDDPSAVARRRRVVNPGWRSERFVVEVGPVPRQTDLCRDATVAAALPARLCVGRSALKPSPDVGNSAEHVHAIDLSDRSGTDLSSSPFYAASLHDAVESLEIPRTARLLSRDQVDDLAAQLQDFIEFVPSEPSVLNHGDLYIGNAIWGGTDVVGLVELEFAVLAPVEVDLNAIVKHAFASGSVTGRIRNCASIVLHREHHALRLPGSFDEPCRCWIVGRWSPVRTVCGNARSGRHFLL